jgi:hypothetical protein
MRLCCLICLVYLLCAFGGLLIGVAVHVRKDVESDGYM